MATSTTTTTTTPVATTVSVTESWIIAHERLILVLIVLIFSAYIGNRWLNYDAAKKDAAAIVAQQQVVDAKKATDAAVAQTALVASQYQSMVDTLTRQNNSLTAAVTQRQATLVVAQKAAAALPPPDLAKRWAVLVPSVVPKVTPTGIEINDIGARDTVASLESVPVLTANLADETTVAGNLQAELGKSNDLTSTLYKEVDSQRILLTDTTKACDTKLSAIKADGRKSKRTWFILGFVSGIATRFAFKF